MLEQRDGICLDSMRVPVILGEIPLKCNPKGPSIRIMENQMEHDMETGDIYLYNMYMYIYIYYRGYRDSVREVCRSLLATLGH